MSQPKGLVDDSSWQDGCNCQWHGFDNGFCSACHILHHVFRPLVCLSTPVNVDLTLDQLWI